MVVRKTVAEWLSFPGKHWSVFLLVNAIVVNQSQRVVKQNQSKRENNV